MKDLTLYAKWAPIPPPAVKYLITWVVNGKTVQQDSVAKDALPVYLGKRPAKPIDKDSLYEFDGWQPKVGRATANVTYTAQFKGSIRSATAVAASKMSALRLYPNPTAGQLSIINYQLGTR